MSQIAEILRIELEHATGRKVRRVWFEPLRRGAEMQGPRGGWLYEDDLGGQEPLGLNAAEAMKQIILYARFNASRESMSLVELLSDERLRPLVLAVRQEGAKSPYVWFNIPDELRDAIEAVE